MSAETSLRIWFNTRLPEPLEQLLRRSLAGHELIFSSREAPVSSIDCDVAFGQPEPAQIVESSRLKWVHVSSAGYTRYDKDAIREALRAHGAAMTTSSDVFADACAQHILAFMLAQARQLPASAEAQRERHWDMRGIRPAVRALANDQTVLIVGYGGIGARLAELLKPFGVRTIGVRQTPRGDEPIEVRPISELDQLLPQADHVVNVLPSSDRTRRWFDATRLARFKPTAVFYNVGRGDTVDQAALRDALVQNRLAAAWLDVTSPEPLPPDDPLWTTPNCHITPHVAGGMQEESARLVAHFIMNFQRYIGGEQLLNRVV